MSAFAPPRHLGARQVSIVRDEVGRKLCKNCRTRPVAKGRQSYCSADCGEEQAVKGSPAYARYKVEQRDRGVCATCGRDTGAIEKRFCRIASAIGEAWWGRHQWREHHLLPIYNALWDQARLWLTREGVEDRIESRYGWRDNNRFGLKHLWEMDHVVPVAEGGGACGLANLRTLCMTCHRAATRALRARLSAARRNG